VFAVLSVMVFGVAVARVIPHYMLS
jgi:hypothetical protein